MLSKYDLKSVTMLKVENRFEIRTASVVNSINDNNNCEIEISVAPNLQVDQLIFSNLNPYQDGV